MFLFHNGIFLQFPYTLPPKYAFKMHFRLNRFGLHYLLSERTRSRFSSGIFLKSQPRCSYKLGSYKRKRVYKLSTTYSYHRGANHSIKSVLCRLDFLEKNRKSKIVSGMLISSIVNFQGNKGQWKM